MKYNSWGCTFKSNVGVEAGGGPGKHAREAEGHEAAGGRVAPVLAARVPQPDADDEQNHHQGDDRQDAVDVETKTCVELVPQADAGLWAGVKVLKNQKSDPVGLAVRKTGKSWG